MVSTYIPFYAKKLKWKDQKKIFLDVIINSVIACQTSE